MNKIELITSNNRGYLDDLASDFAGIYIDAFARPPWNEVSKCSRCGAFSASAVGSRCATCDIDQIPAYSVEELTNQWRDLVDGGALMEVMINDSGVPLRATIAGPLCPAELFARKYQNVPAMEAWLDGILPPEVIYIYDTFANLKISPSGNLSDRGATLGRIANAFSGLPIVTRSIQPAIVRATVRDAGNRTDVYVGVGGAGATQVAGARMISEVPDRRTLMYVEREL